MGRDDDDDMIDLLQRRRERKAQGRQVRFLLVGGGLLLALLACVIVIVAIKGARRADTTDGPTGTKSDIGSKSEAGAQNRDRPGTSEPMNILIVQGRGLYTPFKIVPENSVLRDGVMFLEASNAEWNKNEFAAVEKWKGKRFGIAGSIDSISDTGTVYMQYTDGATYNRMVVCNFKDGKTGVIEDREGLSKLSASKGYVLLEGVLVHPYLFDSCVVRSEQSLQPGHLKDKMAVR